MFTDVNEHRVSLALHPESLPTGWLFTVYRTTCFDVSQELMSHALNLKAPGLFVK